MTEERELETQELWELSKAEKIISTSTDIIDHRISTAILPNDQIYVKKLEKNKHSLERFSRSDMTTHVPIGLLSEGVFYLACKEELPSYIKVSNATQDQMGIDFILSTSSKDLSINLTTNPNKYYFDLKRQYSTPILLPSNKEFFLRILNSEEYTYRDYLNETFLMNNKILRNANDKYRIVVKNRKNDWHVRNPQGSKNYKGYPKKKKRKTVVISGGKEQALFSIISILNNRQ
jgi:hypothetical protein